MIFRYALSIFIGLLGAFCFVWLKLPLPWLLGSITFVIIFSRFLKLQNPKPLTNIARSVLGITIASAFEPEILNSLVHYLASILIIIPFVLVVAYIGTLYYHKALGFDKYTAFFSAVPGGILEMIILSKEFNSDIKQVASSQSIRLLLIVFTLPFVLDYFGDIRLVGNFLITKSIVYFSFKDLAFMILAIILGIFFAKKLNLIGSYMVGPMIVGVIFYFSSFIEQKPPDEIVKLVQVILGTNIGFSFDKISLKTILKSTFATLGYFIILCLICAFFISIVHYITQLPLLSVILAFSPGGQSEINLIAITINADVPYIAMHHLFRVFFIIAIMPNFLRFFKMG